MSKNIKTDYGAVGDGQLQTLTVSFVSGSSNLVIFSNTFSGGDVSKKIAVQDWIPASGGNPDGALLCTINSVGSFSVGQQTIVLDQNATQTYASASKQVEWGTDDSGAFLDMNTDQAGLDCVLIIPAGRYCFARSGSGTQIGLGLNSLTVNGSGSPVLTDMLGSGNGCTLNINGVPLFNDNTAESLIQTISAGQTVLHFVTPGDESKYTANTWAWMTGYDIQGFGNPPNLYFNEWVYISSIDTSAHTVTLSAPLKNSYKSTWPQWSAGTPGTGAPTYTGGSFSLGGPATLYLINQNWNNTQVWNDVNFRSTPTVMNAGGKDITVNNSTFEAFGLNCSMQRSLTMSGITCDILWELDKGTETFSLSNSTVRGFIVFSSQPNNLVFDNVTITFELNGTPRNLTATNSAFPTEVNLGPTSYSVCDSANISDSTFAGQLIVGGVKETDLTGSGGYSMSGGIISRALSGGTGEPPQWATPNRYFYIGSRTSIENTAFKVLDIYDDGTTLYIQTDQSGGFPSPVSPATTISANAAPPVNFTFSGCTGCDDAVSWSNVTPSRPMFSQWKETYSGDIGFENPDHQIKIDGQVVSIKVTVTSGYSAGTFTLDDPFVIYKPQNTQATYPMSIDMTVPGVRTITPSGVTGAAGADSNLDLPNGGSVWLVDNQLTASMSSASGTGTVTLEIATDLGIVSSAPAVVPLRLRLHS
jgi:hypothetical protein